MRSIIIALVSLICVAGMSVSAQTTVSGSVANKAGEALAGSTVLFVQADTVAGGTVTDSKGRFELKGLPKGEYECQVSMLGYRPASQKFTLTDKVKLPKFELEEDATMLGEVTVTGDARKMTKELAGMSIYYLTDRAKKEPNAYMALREIPRLRVNETSRSITLDNGTTPLILVDGVKKPLDVLSPEMIASVEVIDNPSARYRGDSEVASVLNIKLKKEGVKPYLRGNLSAQSNYDAKFMTSQGAFELGSSTSSLYLTAQYMRTHKRRNSSFSDIYQGDLHQELNTGSKSNSQSIFFELGGDNLISKNNYIAYSIKYLTVPSNGKSNTAGEITDKTINKTSPLISMTTYENRYKQLAGNLYYKHSFNNSRTLEITGNYYYSLNGNTTDREETCDFFNYISGIDLDNSRHMGKLDANYSDMLTGSIHLETGSNTEYSVTNIDDRLDQWPNFRYRRTREYLYAGIDNNRSQSKFNYVLSLGLDMVFSDAAGVKNSYVDFVPSASFNYWITNRNCLTLNYNRSRQMPSAGSLNPRNTSTDLLIVNQGNPMLKPSHKDNVTLGYMFTNGTIRLYPYMIYTYDSDLVMPYSYLDGDVYVNTYQNFGHTSQLMPGASLDYNFPQGENHYGNISLNAYYLKQYIKGMPFSGNSYNVTLNGMYGYKRISFSAYLGLFGPNYTLYSKTRLSLFSSASVYWNVSRAVTLSFYTEGFLCPKMHYKTWVSNGDDYHSFTSSVPRNLSPKLQFGVSYTFVTKNFKWRNQKKFYSNDNELQTIKTN